MWFRFFILHTFTHSFSHRGYLHLFIPLSKFSSTQQSFFLNEIFPVLSDHSDFLLYGPIAPTVLLILLTFVADCTASPSALLSGVIIYFFIFLCQVHLYSLMHIFMIKQKQKCDGCSKWNQKKNKWWYRNLFFFLKNQPL